MLLLSWPSPQIAAVSHAIAALAFLLVALLLLHAWRRRRELHRAAMLIAACAITACWALAVAIGYARGLQLAATDSIELLETLRTAAWLVLLLLLCGGQQQQRQQRAGLAAIVLLSLLVLAASVGYVCDSAGMPYFPLAAQLGAALDPTLCIVVPRLALAVLGMLLVEQLYRGAQQQARWGIKYVCLGMGALFAYDFYLYSDALLLRQISPEIWAARGAVNALSAPLLAVAATRNPSWRPGLSLSRQLLFRSAALLGSALYLLAMAGSAYYLRYVGGAWGPLMQLACLFGAMLLLAGVLFSGAMRARLKVFINKHFYQGRYDYRHEWLRFTRGLADDGLPLGERAIQALAGLVESPAGVLWLRGEAGAFQPAAHWNLPPRAGAQDGAAGEHIDGALCRFLEQRAWVVSLPEYRRHPERYGELRLPGWLLEASELWLVVPLLLERRLFGFVCLALPRSPMPLNWEVLDVLKIAGGQAASYLAQRAYADRLMVARQFESFNRMSAFIVHDLKNLVSQLSLLLLNAERHKANPAFQEDMLETLAHSVGRMKALLAKLSRTDSGEAAEPAMPLLLDQLLAQAVQAHAALEPRPSLAPAPAGLYVLANPQRLLRVIGHLIQNAVEATPPGGSVALRLSDAGQAALIELRDTGAGMSEQFIRERLFQPFESTKAAGMGIGVFESREYLRELGGRLEVDSVPARGTTFRVFLPLLRDAAAVAAAA